MKRLVVGAAAVALLATPLLVSTAPKISGVPPWGGQAQSAMTAPEAARFLTQATFGPTDSSISDVQASGYAAWIDTQESMPVSASHLAAVDARLAQLQATNPRAFLKPADLFDTIWAQSVTGPDQLRQRVKMALSEIFVISAANKAIEVRGAASYYDMLGESAFVNFRMLLERVALHPEMGVYLTYVANQKEDTTTGRHPDENFAREIEQLMSIGLYKLNQDGTLQTDANGAPIRNYTSSDIQGLAKVFTGYSWYATTPTNKTFLHYFNSFPAAAVTPMIPYPAFHSTAQKSFLGTTIPASATPDPAGDLKIALDTIFNNPNVGPFIGKQLIQRLVTSNPSRAYVSRVAAVFNDNGAGVRGDMAAVIKAILLDPEARDTAGAQSSPTFGKLREPVIRVTNWMRAFNATSSSGSWLVGRTSAPVNLDQTVMNAPSVFNFFRPGYSPPGTTLGDQGLVAPEFQIVDEVTVVGYLNTIQAAVGAGIGDIVQVAGHAQPDVRSTYGNEVALAADAGPLVDRVDLLLTYGQMSPTLRSRVLAAVNSIKIPAASAPQAQKDAALLHRAQLAAFLTLASPEYLTQR